jgi:hypothetical protein
MLLLLNLPLVRLWVKVAGDPARRADRRHPRVRHARRLLGLRLDHRGLRDVRESACSVGPLMEAQSRRTLLFVLAILALVVPVAVSSVRRVRGLGEEED